MASKQSEDVAPGGAGDQSQIPQSMIQQAEAVMASENDQTRADGLENKHMGHDVTIADARSATGDGIETNAPPPTFGDHYGDISNDTNGFGTKASVTDDGRVNIRITQEGRNLSSALLPTLKRLQEAREKEEAPPPPYVPPSLGGSGDQAPPPPLNVVIQIVGSRGDVQPFVALGKVLKEKYGHRVRLATHPNFKDFVNENGLEFFSIGADPAALMAFMVKNPGLMPGFDALRAGDIGKRRKEVAEYLRGCWRSCFETGDGTGPEITDENMKDLIPQGQGDDRLLRPFVADCIIANPPSFAHIHIAEKMGVPFHCYFTMPYSPTQAFPHPLANIQTTNADENITNYITYTLIEMLTWQGLGDVINRFRQQSLGLEPVSMTSAPGMLQRLRVPFTYCWSPALIPKPKDWGPHINISGFYFLDLASNFSPDADLKAFLDAGPPPVYIGFGSIVLDDPNAMTKLLFDAVRKTGQRALVSKGWGGMGADELGKPDNVFMLGNCPHDWLFTKVSCVVHHGGAGTTAAGITAGRPTVVVPFFGDQPFWGSMVARAGAGPPPIPHKQLTADNLADAINKCLEPESQNRAAELASKIAAEKGTDEGAKAFHQFLEVDKLRCHLSPSRAAVWRVKRTQVRLSAMAACTLANEGLLEFSELKLFRAKEYETDQGPWDPVTGGASAIVGTASSMMLGVADFPIETLKALRIHPDTAKSKKSENKTEGATSSQATSRPMSRSTSDVGQSPESDLASPEIEASDGTRGVSGAQSPPVASSSSSFSLQESLTKLDSKTSSFDGTNKPPSSMAAALSGNLAANRSRSNSPSRRSSNAKANAGDLLRTTMDTSKGVQRIVSAGLKSPMDFTLNVAKGFHNAPKLYGDDTVRKADQVTDFKSGLKAATKGFGFGMYDGITGLVSQPMIGAQKEGPAGFLKGVGKGIGGIVLKPSAAFFSIPGYTMMGVYKEMQKHFGSSVQGYIVAARTAQGYDDWQRSSLDEKRAIVQRWKALQLTLKKKRNPDELVKDILQEQIRKKEVWVDSKRAAHAERRRNSQARSSNPRKTGAPPDQDPESALLSIGARPAPQTDEEALQEAIRRSIQETSEGNKAADLQAEREIQADMQRFMDRSQRNTDQGDDEYERAIAESAADAQRRQQSDTLFDEELEHALAQSLKEHRGWQDSKQVPSASDDFGPPPPSYDDVYAADRTSGVAAPSLSEPKPISEKTHQERTEEDVVLEYIKKQSILEEEHRRKAQTSGQSADLSSGSAQAGSSTGDAQDEELQRALKLSLQESQQQ